MQHTRIHTGIMCIHYVYVCRCAERLYALLMFQWVGYASVYTHIYYVFICTNAGRCRRSSHEMPYFQPLNALFSTENKAFKHQLFEWHVTHLTWRIWSYIWSHIWSHIWLFVCTDSYCITMGWLRSVGSIKSQVSSAKEPYKRDNILQKRPVI